MLGHLHAGLFQAVDLLIDVPQFLLVRSTEVSATGKMAPFSAFPHDSTSTNRICMAVRVDRIGEVHGRRTHAGPLERIPIPRRLCCIKLRMVLVVMPS